MERAVILIAALGVGSAVAAFAACGSDDLEPGALVEQYEGGTASTPEAGAADAEHHVAAFPCGATSCISGEHACCEVSGAFACFSLEAGGCPIVDAGADADAAQPSPFLCATYNNCKQDENCCYVLDAGSSCATSCPEGAYRLCQRGVDSCGKDEGCADLSPPPLPNTGRCKSD